MQGNYIFIWITFLLGIADFSLDHYFNYFLIYFRRINTLRNKNILIAVGAPLFILLIMFTLFATTVYAQDGSDTEQSADFIDGSLMLFYYDYKEQLPRPLKSTESGFLPGLVFTYTDKIPNSKFFLRGSAEFAFGPTVYDGTTQSGVPVISNTDNIFGNLEANIGINFDKKETISIYSGVGFHYWNRGLKGSAPYREDYTWFYFPAGFIVNLDISNRFQVSIDACLRFMFMGTIKVYLSDISSYFNDPIGDLGNKIGGKIKIPFRYVLDNEISLLIMPWVEYSAIEQSNQFSIKYGGTSIGFAMEPSSETYQYGINIGVRYLL